VHLRDPRAPTDIPFNPNSSISLPAGIASGFLKIQPALGFAGWEDHRRCANARSRLSIVLRSAFAPRSIADNAI